MGTTAAVPVEEYLSTTYHPDCDYVYGHLEDRNQGEPEHAELQTAISAYHAKSRSDFAFVLWSKYR